MTRAQLDATLYSMKMLPLDSVPWRAFHDEIMVHDAALRAECDALKEQVMEWKRKYLEASDEKLRVADQDLTYQFVAKERDHLEQQVANLTRQLADVTKGRL
jgi:predicted nuclease of restriction endonuclease-like RecB superfamily